MTAQRFLQSYARVLSRLPAVFGRWHQLDEESQSAFTDELVEFLDRRSCMLEAGELSRRTLVRFDGQLLEYKSPIAATLGIDVGRLLAPDDATFDDPAPLLCDDPCTTLAG